MKLKEDLLERVRKGELIVENDNNEVIGLIFNIQIHIGQIALFKQGNVYWYGNYLCQFIKKSKIIKASELIEKEDYTKPLKEGQLCVFFINDEGFTISKYRRYEKVRTYCQESYSGTYTPYAFPITGKETIEEIQEKINNYLKDK